MTKLPKTVILLWPGMELAVFHKQGGLVRQLWKFWYILIRINSLQIVKGRVAMASALLANTTNIRLITRPYH